MAFTAGFSVNVGDPTKASDVDVLAANDDYLKNAIDTFIANDANNRVLTGTGSGTANAEANLTFDGSTLTVTGTVSATTFSGNVTGNLTGDVTGNINGNVTGGTISGSTGSFTSTISTSGGYVTVAGNPSAGTISSNGNGQIGGLTGNGLYMYGKGSTYDLALANANTTVALAIPTGGSATPDVYIPNSLGIGTDSPQGPLTVKPATNENLNIVGGSGDLRLSALNDAQSATVQLSIQADPLYIRGTGGVIKSAFLGNGNVGIGTTSPVALSNQTSLTVNGTSVGRVDVKAGGGGGGVMFGTSSALTLQANSGVAVNLDSASGQPITFQVGSSEKARIDSSGDLLVLGGTIRTKSADNSQQYGAIYGNTSEFSINSGVNNLGLYSAGTLALTIDSSQRVGISTDSPLSGLHISDGVAYGSPQNASRKGTLTISAGTEASADLQFLNANYNHIFFGDSADANVGALLYDHTNNSMQFAVNGSERARITSAGNFEVTKSGSAEGLAKFESNDDLSIKLKSTFSASNGAGIYIEHEDAYTSTTNAFQAGIPQGDTNYAIGYGGIGGFLAANSLVTVTSAGNCGIGSQSPTYKLVVSNGGAAGYEFNVNGLNSGVNTVVYNRSTSAYVDSAHFVDNYYIYSGQTPAERFRVESTGVCAFMTPNVNIRFNGTATSTVLTDNNGVEIYTGGFIWAARQATSLYLSRAGSTGEIAAFRYNAVTQVGSISVTSTATAYNTSSDYRLKENLVPITGAVDRVNALQPRRFNFISDPDTTVDGFVAHEVSPIVPESVNGEKDAVDEDGNPEYQGIDQSKLVPLLTAAIQELTARIEALEAS